MCVEKEVNTITQQREANLETTSRSYQKSLDFLCLTISFTLTLAKCRQIASESGTHILT